MHASQPSASAPVLVAGVRDCSRPRGDRGHYQGGACEECAARPRPVTNTQRARGLRAWPACVATWRSLPVPCCVLRVTHARVHVHWVHRPRPTRKVLPVQAADQARVASRQAPDLQGRWTPRATWAARLLGSFAGVCPHTMAWCGCARVRRCACGRVSSSTRRKRRSERRLPRPSRHAAAACATCRRRQPR